MAWYGTISAGARRAINNLIWNEHQNARKHHHEEKGAAVIQLDQTVEIIKHFEPAPPATPVREPAGATIMAAWQRTIPAESNEAPLG
jgi:hypothetical protein